MTETFATIAVFQYSAEARIVKGRLEADGIETFLRDSHTIDTDPLVSNAIGGVKLNVWSEDKEKALEILESINNYSVDDEGVEMVCPQCKSPKLQLLSNVQGVKSFLAFIFSFLMVALPVHIRYDYQCENCKTKFKIK